MEPTYNQKAITCPSTRLFKDRKMTNTTALKTDETMAQKIPRPRPLVREVGADVSVNPSTPNMDSGRHTRTTPATQMTMPTHRGAEGTYGWMDKRVEVIE